jgi:hypothetical protein
VLGGILLLPEFEVTGLLVAEDLVDATVDEVDVVFGGFGFGGFGFGWWGRGRP